MWPISTWTLLYSPLLGTVLWVIAISCPGGVHAEPFQLELFQFWSQCHCLSRGTGHLVHLQVSLKSLWSLFLINIHPLLSPPPTPEKSLCIPYKLRLGFILTVNLYVTHDRPRQFLVFFNENARCTNPPRLLVFSQVKCVLRSMWL